MRNNEQVLIYNELFFVGGVVDSGYDNQDKVDLSNLPFTTWNIWSGKFGFTCCESWGILPIYELVSMPSITFILLKI